MPRAKTKVASSEPTEPKQKPQLFKPGQSGNPAGRPKGSRNKLQENFLAALSDDFAENGIEAIQTMRLERPSDYIRTIASLMPKQLEIERPLQDLSDDELASAISALKAYIDTQGIGEGSGNAQSAESAHLLQALH